jgi:hypothetical protein
MAQTLCRKNHRKFRAFAQLATDLQLGTMALQGVFDDG